MPHAATTSSWLSAISSADGSVLRLENFWLRLRASCDAITSTCCSDASAGVKPSDTSWEMGLIWLAMP